LAALGAAEAWLTRRWLAGKRTVAWADRETAAAKVPAISAIEAGGAWEITPPWRRRLRCLVWREWRQALRPALGITGATLLLIHYFGETWDTTRPLTYNVGANAAILLAPLLMGVFAFHDEQRSRSYRFLSERGASPWIVWLSKHAIWFPLAMGVTILLVVLSPPVVRLFWRNYAGLMADGVTYRDAFRFPMIFPVYGSHPHVGYETGMLWWSAGVPIVFGLQVVLGYSAGQLVSLLIPRGITATFAGLILGVVCFFWYLLMSSFSVPLGLSVLPLPLIFLVVTLVRVGDWMEGRNTWRAWWKVGVVGLVPVACVVFGVMVYRVYEIPAVELNFFDEDIPQPATESERATAAAYERAILQALAAPTPLRDQAAFVRRSDQWMPPNREEADWIAKNDKVIQQLLETSRQPDCALLDPASATTDEYDKARSLATQYLELVRLLVVSAHLLEGEGDLNQALDRYLAALRLGRHAAQKGGIPQFVAGRSLNEYVYYWMTGWAAHPAQRPELLQQAAERLRAYANSLPRPSAAVNVHFAVLRQTLGSKERFAWTLLHQWIPDAPWTPALSWERARWRRQLNLANSFQYWYLKDFERAFERPRFACIGWWPQWPSSFARSLPAVPSAIRRRFYAGVLDRYVTMSRFEFGELPSDVRLPIVSSVGHETRLRALLINIELIRYRLEHGQLPASLDELRGTSSPEWLLDPWTGRDFGYKPHGVWGRIVLRNGETVLAAEKPFLWSAGPWNVQLRPSPYPTHRASSLSLDEFTFVDVRDEVISSQLEPGSRSFEQIRMNWPAFPLWLQMWDVGQDSYGGILFPVPAGR